MNESRRTAARLVFYRDLFLFWPFFLSTWIAGALAFSADPVDKKNGLICAATAAMCLLLARRRLGLVVAAVAFMASRFLYSIRRPSDWYINLAVYAAGALLLWGIGRLHESRSFRRMIRDDLHEFRTDEPTLTDLLVNLAGLVGFFVLMYLVVFP